MKRLAFVLMSFCIAWSSIVRSAETSATSETGGFIFQDDTGVAVTLTGVAGSGDLELVWPEPSRPDWDTALLRLSVSAGNDVSEPYVDINIGAQNLRQYLRAGDSGQRWLNLSLLHDELLPGTRVRLDGVGVTLNSEAARLHLFDNDLDLTQRMLVLASHPDDAEIAAFGLYAQRNATIITVTPGNAGPRSYSAVFNDTAEMYHFKGKLRLIDSVTVPWLGGIPPERCFNLGYFNGRLKQMYDAPDTAVAEVFSSNTDIGAYLPYNIGSLLPKQSRSATWTHLVEDLVTVLHKVKPTLIVAPHPQLDAHRDHQYTTVALAEALSQAKLKDEVSLLLYTNHADQNRYPYGPAGTLMSLPPTPQRVHLDSVYSHPVAPETQRLKLFALEAMHDLRPSPSRLYQLTLGDDRAQEPEAQDPAGGINYLRRGPRANELFYVYDQASFKPMIESFLAR